jgi:3-deoxy-D-manno-octulosonate 8-phosphate phosphatase KdsC-like HAD superfamily phosphatase
MVISNNNLLGQDAKRYLRTCLESRYNETDMVDLREPQHSVLNINGAGSEKTVKNCFSFHSGKRSKSTIDDYCSRDSKQVLPRNYRIILLSGDKQSVVESIAKELGIEEYYFEKTPDKKLEILQKLKSDGKNILMIGDGINDAPSLIQADVSMSPASAADISKNVADIIFQGDKLYPILETILTAKKSNQIIKQNLFFSLIYNLVAVPFAMIGYIVPFFAALAMSSSSIVVVVNALRIRKNNLFFTLKK